MKTIRMMRKGFWRRWRSVAPLLAASVSVVIALFFHGCGPKSSATLHELPRAVYDEEWRIAGVIDSKVPEGKTLDDWIAVLEFPQNKITRIIPAELPGPYGDGGVTGLGRPVWLAYNETAGVIVHMARAQYPDPDPEQPIILFFVHDAADVLVYDLQTKKNKWIGRNRWLLARLLGLVADETKDDHPPVDEVLEDEGYRLQDFRGALGG